MIDKTTPYAWFPPRCKRQVVYELLANLSRHVLGSAGAEDDCSTGGGLHPRPPDKSLAGAVDVFVGWGIPLSWEKDRILLTLDQIIGFRGIKTIAKNCLKGGGY